MTTDSLVRHEMVTPWGAGPLIQIANGYFWIYASMAERPFLAHEIFHSGLCFCKRNVDQSHDR